MKRPFFISGLALALGLGAHAAPAPANFNGNWNCVYNGKNIPGALTQRGTQLQGYCIYPGGNRATFQGTVNGNTLSGTLYVDRNTQRTISATLSGNTMRGNWSTRGSGGGPWSATRR